MQAKFYLPFHIVFVFSDVNISWEDYELWWPARKWWLNKMGQVLEKYEVQADAKLFYTPRHKVSCIVLHVFIFDASENFYFAYNSISLKFSTYVIPFLMHFSSVVFFIQFVFNIQDIFKIILIVFYSPVEK